MNSSAASDVYKRQGFEGVGHMVQNLVRMSTWADAARTSNFVESWTVFYWAWWLALGPYMGIFICKISRGRTRYGR